MGTKLPFNMNSKVNKRVMRDYLTDQCLSELKGCLVIFTYHCRPGKAERNDDGS
jgi:hypothetical protein